MKHYTTDEYQQLIGMLKKEGNNYYLHINGPEFLIGNKILPQYIFDSAKRLKHKRSILIKFLHSTTLRRVPLYMSKLPELCKWRLRIGK